MPEGPASILTRFRAYQLATEGSSFSYFSEDKFTLIEGRLTETSKSSVADELEVCNRTTIDTLHITSWDQDHCDEKELSWLLRELSPVKIEYPGYPPHTDNANACLAVISKYKRVRAARNLSVEVQRIDPAYINGLKRAQDLAYRDVVYHPKAFYVASNDNSTVKLFRRGSFNVASLGDVEHANIGAYLRRCRIFRSEVDILIVPHHGAETEIMKGRLLQEVKPTIAICSSNYDNQYEHPRPAVKRKLFEQEIPVFTTKTGDVIVESVAPHATKYRVTNLIAGSTKVSSSSEYTSKKARLLRMNADTLRSRYNPGFKGLK